MEASIDINRKVIFILYGWHTKIKITTEHDLKVEGYALPLTYWDFPYGWLRKVFIGLGVLNFN